MKFSWIQNKPLLCSAPMHGITNSSQRRIFKKFGADVTFSEMVSSIAFHYQNKKTLHKTYFTKTEKPIIIQVFGHNTQEIIESAKFMESIGADGIDFNCGCPARNMIASGNGGALLKEPENLINILSGIKTNVNIPVSLKTRIGYDEILEPKYYQNIAKNSGIDCLIIHGRTVKQQYRGEANWEQIRKISQKLNIPVIGCGDITTPHIAYDRIKNYTPSGIMIARGSLGQPWIFEKTKKLLLNKKIRTKINLNKITSTIKYHCQLLIKEFKNQAENSEKNPIIQMRKHFGWYIKNVPFAKEYRQQLFQCTTMPEVEEILRKILSHEKI